MSFLFRGGVLPNEIARLPFGNRILRLLALEDGSRRCELFGFGNGWREVTREQAKELCFTHPKVHRWFRRNCQELLLPALYS